MDVCSSSNRIYPLDMARALGMLWIVGFWHLHDYFPLIYQLSSDASFICGKITIIVLATFTFISGYLLRKYRFSSKAEIFAFYWKRFKRFWVLFFWSSLILYFTGWMTTVQFVFNITGLGYISPTRTLWYISMLMFFYLFTPILNQSKKLLIGAVFFSVFLALGYFHLIDRRFLMYYPFYWIGLNFPEKRSFRKPIDLIASAILLTICFGFHLNGFFIDYVYMAAGVYFLISICYLIQCDVLKRLVSITSYASMCSYLFHREILEAAKIILPNNVILPCQGILLLILIIFISYSLQYVYDLVVVRWK